MNSSLSSITFSVSDVLSLPGDSVAIRNGYYSNNNYQGRLGKYQYQKQLCNIPDSIIPPQILRALPYDDHMKIWTIKNFGLFYIPRKRDLIKVGSAEALLYKMIMEYEMECPVAIDWKRHVVKADGRIIRKYRFQHDYYFMAGDNVSNSNDSRFWGLVPDEYIVGVVDEKLTCRK